MLQYLPWPLPGWCYCTTRSKSIASSSMIVAIMAQEMGCWAWLPNSLAQTSLWLALGFPEATFGKRMLNHIHMCGPVSTQKEGSMYG